MREWILQVLWIVGRAWSRALYNTYMISFAVLCLAGGLLIFRFAPEGSSAFLFLQMQLFLLPLFAILMGCGSLHDDLEELAVLFSQPLFRSAYLFGKWFAEVGLLALVTALAIAPYGLLRGKGEIFLLMWVQGLFLSGVFVALGLFVAALKRDRARGLIISLLVWLVLVFGYDAIAYFAVQSGWAMQSPILWVSMLVANPPDIFRTSVLFSLEEIPFNVPAMQPSIVWMLSHLTLLMPMVCSLWIAVVLLLTTWRLQRGVQ